jgi:mRNA turnover protein 4
VSLTKADAKGRSLKSKHVDTVRSAIDEYESIYVFSYENMRASKFKDVRMHWRESRIFMGKNTVSQVALGRSTADEFKDNLRLVSKKLQGDVGLFFTSRDKAEVLE